MAITGTVDIINLALGNLSTGTKVQSLQDASPELEQAQLHYEVALEATLSDHPWGFAMRERRLAQIAGYEGVQWRRAWGYPVDAAMVWEVTDDLGRAAPFSVGSSPAGVKAILSDGESAVAAYTARNVAVADMTAQFVVAFSWRLAAEIAAGLLGDAELSATASQGYLLQLEKAKTRDAREGAARPPRPSQWMLSRHA